MGLRGAGAKTLKQREEDALTLRQEMPWHVKGLSRVERVVAFLEDLTVTQGKLAGKPFRVRPFQRKFLDAVYAEDADGNRPVRTALLSLARKNGKTQLAAALALCHLCGPESEMRGEVYACANDRFQAGKTFNEMCAMIAKHAEIENRLNVTKFRKEIEVLSGEGEGSIFAALSSDAATKMGLNPSYTVFDELGSAPKRDLFEALDTATGGRENPLMMVISTQAPDDLHIMSELVDYSAKIDSGEIVDPSFHGMVYAAPVDADPWSYEAWEAANPALNDFRSLADVERQSGQAQKMPSKEHSFRNLILNQRIAAHVRFLSKAAWDAGGEKVLNLAEGSKCFIGIDLGSSQDLTAIVAAFPQTNGEVHLLPIFFLPKVGLAEKSESDRVPWDVWAKADLLNTSDGKTVDPRDIALTLAKLAASFDVQRVVADPWKLDVLVRELERIGAPIEVEQFPQRYQFYNPAVNLFERLVVEGLVHHGAHPILTMCASNVVLKTDAAGNRMPAKNLSSGGKIDGIVAALMAVASADMHKPEPVSAFISQFLPRS